MSDPPLVSDSAGTVRPFLVMEILERAQELEREGYDIVHLEVGEPDFNVPRCAEEAAVRAIREGSTHYTHSLGIFELRQEISRHYRRRHGVDVPLDRVIVTSGSSGGLALLMALLVEPGDDVLLPTPGYSCYANFVRAFHARPRYFRLEPSSGFRYDPESIRKVITDRTRALLVNSPSNPTATVQSADTLRELAALGMPLLSDEIYHGLEYGARATSALEVTENAFVLDGFSKRHAMTGWRIGWLVAPPGYVEPIQRLQQNLFICAGSVAQHAALAALREGQADVEAMRSEYDRRREVLLRGLRRLGFPVPATPEGAYYVFVDARHLGADSLATARRILEEAHVGVTPGIDFGPAGEGHLRFSFASALDRIEEGLRRLEVWLKKRA